MRVAFILDNIILGQEPLGVTTMGSILKKDGHEVGYFSIPKDRGEWSTDEVVSFKPDVAGFSVSTGLHHRYLDFNGMLRAELPNLYTIFGGPHPSFFPNCIEKEGVDAICVGEGEAPMQDLVNSLGAGERPDGIAGLHIKQADGSVQVNPPARFIRNLDDIPLPDHSFLDEFPHLRDSPIAYLMCGRGCPWNCNFCFNHVSRDLQEGRFIRYRSPANVIEECLILRDRYGKRFMAFQDDTFSLSIGYLRKLLPLYKEKVGLPYLAHLRADNVTPEMAQLLASTGCQRGVVGVENGNEKIRNEILDKGITDEHLITAATLLRENGIEFLSQNMFGVPGETIETVLSTIEINIKCQTRLMVLHFFQPYPGTGLGKIAEEMDLWHGTVDDIPESNHWHVVLDLEDKDLMTRLGHLSYFFLDYPKAFYALKPLLSRKATRSLASPLLNLCAWLDNKTLYGKKRGAGSRWQPPKSVVASPEACTTDIDTVGDTYCAMA